MILIFYLSSFGAPKEVQGVPTIAGHIKIVHLVEYGVLSGLYLLGFIKATNINEPYKAIFSILLSFCYGITDELHQIFVPSRTSSVYDVITNLIGSVVFIAVVYMVRKLFDKNVKRFS